MLQTASTATATTALADDQQEAARAITCANEAAEGHRAAQFERDGAFSTVVDLREEMTVQTASTTTVTTALAATRKRLPVLPRGLTKPQRGVVRQSANAIV